MTPEVVRRSQVVVDGVRSPVIEAGPDGVGQAVVFVHGNPGSSEDWVDLIGRTGRFARALAFDMPGFGTSDKPPTFQYTVPGYARFIGQALRQLGVNRVHLVVHDFGGPFGLAWAATDPGAFAGVVIINAPPVSDYRWYLLAKVWRTPLLGELLHVSLVRPFFNLNVNRGRGRPVPGPFVDRMWRDYDRGTRRAVLELYRATDARAMVPAPPAFFRSLDRPALVVWGRRDAYIPSRFAERHLEAFPRAEVVYLDRSGHWPFMDDPEGVAAAALPFLRRQTGDGEA